MSASQAPLALLEPHSASAVYLLSGSSRLPRELSDFEQLHAELRAEHPALLLPAFPAASRFVAALTSEPKQALAMRLEPYLAKLKANPRVAQLEELRHFLSAAALERRPRSLVARGGEALSGGVRSLGRGLAALWRGGGMPSDLSSEAITLAEKGLRAGEEQLDALHKSCQLWLEEKQLQQSLVERSAEVLRGQAAGLGEAPALGATAARVARSAGEYAALAQRLSEFLFRLETLAQDVGEARAAVQNFFELKQSVWRPRVLAQRDQPHGAEAIREDVEDYTAQLHLLAAQAEAFLAAARDAAAALKAAGDADIARCRAHCLALWTARPN